MATIVAQSAKSASSRKPRDEESRFPEENLDMVRAALHRYRQKNAQAGRALLQVIELATDIQHCASNKTYYEGHEFFEPEALRRFLNGINRTLSRIRLKHIVNFLREKHYLRDDDIRSDQHHEEELLAVSGYLSDEIIQETDEQLSKLHGEWIAERELAGYFERYELSIRPSTGPRGVRVKELFKAWSESIGQSAEDPGVQEERKGYAFTLKRHNLLQVFLHSEVPKAVISYVELVKREGSVGKFVLLRTKAVRPGVFGYSTGMEEIARDSLLAFDLATVVPKRDDESRKKIVKEQTLRSGAPRSKSK